jgi:hypothetical protein
LCSLSSFSNGANNEQPLSPLVLVLVRVVLLQLLLLLLADANSASSDTAACEACNWSDVNGPASSDCVGVGIDMGATLGAPNVKLSPHLKRQQAINNADTFRTYG